MRGAEIRTRWPVPERTRFKIVEPLGQMGGDEAEGDEVVCGGGSLIQIIDRIDHVEVISS